MPTSIIIAAPNLASANDPEDDSIDDVLSDHYLTDREIEVLAWIAEGKSDLDIAGILSISPKTVNYHVENAKRKFRFPTRMQVIVSAVRRGLF